MSYPEGELLKHRWSGLDEMYVLLGYVASEEAAKLGFLAIMGATYAVLGCYSTKRGIEMHSVDENDLERCYEVCDG